MTKKRANDSSVWVITIVIAVVFGYLAPLIPTAHAEEDTKSSKVTITFVNPTDEESIKELERIRQEQEDERVREIHYLEVIAPGEHSITKTMISNNRTVTFKTNLEEK